MRLLPLPWLFGLEVAQLVLLVALALIVRRLSERTAKAAANPPGEALARELGASINRLAGELQAEHQRLRDTLDQARALSASLGAVSVVAAEPVTQESAGDAGGPGNHSLALAREQARLALAAGASPETVADSTGLPVGEVQVLANLLKAKGGVGAADTQ